MPSPGAESIDCNENEIAFSKFVNSGVYIDNIVSIYSWMLTIQPSITDFTVGLYVQTRQKVRRYLDFIKSSAPPGECF